MKSYIEHIVFWTADCQIRMQSMRTVRPMSFMQLIIGKAWQEERHLSVKAAAERAVPAAIMITVELGVGHFL